MPLHDAFYLAATDKIYGVQENYIVQFNATTGAKENSAKVCSPLYGPMRIVGRGSVLYVSSFADRGANDVNGVGLTSNRKIWNVDGVTLASTDVLGVDAKHIVADGRTFNNWGPQFMLIYGNDIWYLYGISASAWVFERIDVTNPTDFDLNKGGAGSFMAEMFATDGSNLYFSNGVGRSIQMWDMATITSADTCSIIPYRATAVEYAPNVGNLYCTTEVTEALIRIDTFTPDAYTVFNLGTIFANVRPMRLRYRSSDGLIYLPCQNQDVVIKWNPVSNTGTYIDGFDSPIDVVFTPTKAFAVQTGLQSLKEIT